MICLRMLEKESLITELARVEVCHQLNGRNRYPFATFDTRGRSQGLHSKQLCTSLDGLELVVPGTCSPIVEEHAPVGLVCLKSKLIGDVDTTFVNCGAVLKVLEHWENTAAEGPLLAFEELLLNG